MNRHLAHSYRDELPPPRVTIEPIVTTWREAVVILAQVFVLAALGYAFLVLLLSSGPR